MPTSPVGSNGLYYDVKVSCGSSKTSGLWDYNAWHLNLDYIESNSKCTLTFTSSMSKEEYDKYIQAGVALRRNTYRGKDITNYYTGKEQVNGKDLYKQISDGTFDDIYVGDYFKGTSETIWLIADLDNYFGSGRPDNVLKTHHATIIPAYKLQDSQMNSTDTTDGAYAGSEMYSKTLPDILKNKIEPDFTKDEITHIIEYHSTLSMKVNSTYSNQKNTVLGASSNWSWFTGKLDLMSEVNVYGTTVWSSSGFDIAQDNRQYAIFQLRPDLINWDLDGNRFSYWLKAVVSSQEFATVDQDSGAAFSKASNNFGVRPRFLIGTPDA